MKEEYNQMNKLDGVAFRAEDESFMGENNNSTNLANVMTPS
jgi:hypothetical protein